MGFVLFWIGGGYIGASAIAIAIVVPGPVRNQCHAFFPAGIMSEFLEFL